MGNAINPNALHRESWDSHWFEHDKKVFADRISEDYWIRWLVFEYYRRSPIIDRVVISRSGDNLSLSIYTINMGYVLRGGRKGIKDLWNYLTLHLKKKAKLGRIGRLSRFDPSRISVYEVRDWALSARVIAGMIGKKILNRMHIKKAMRQVIDRAMESENVKGIKVIVSSDPYGKPVGDIRGNVSVSSVANRVIFEKDSYIIPNRGTIGIKVWINPM